MNIILFDSEITGHHSEYLDHIVTYLVTNPSNDIYNFVVHPDFGIKFKNIASKSDKNPNIIWHALKPEEIASLKHLSIAKRSFAEFSLVEYYAKELIADTVYLLHFNAFQLALTVKRPQFKIKGILFNQFFRMAPKRWKEKMKYSRKYLITKLYCTNSAIESVFVLNDSKSVTLFNQKFDTDIFKMLPDPIPDIEPLHDFLLREKYNLHTKKKIFLHFGSLAVRKGTLDVIEAATAIPAEKQNDIVILLVGKAESTATEQQMQERIAHARKYSAVEIIWENHFVSNALMKSLFLQSTAVVMPYKNPEASSGILGHALAAKKPVIITGKGLLRELVEEHNFGILLDSISPKSIAQALLEVQDIRADTKSYIDYINEHTPIKFAEILMNS